MTAPATSSGWPIRFIGTLFATAERFSSLSSAKAIIFDSKGPGAMQLTVICSGARVFAICFERWMTPAFDAPYG